MSFFEELKRRNVFRVGVAYAVLAWLLIQVIDTVLPRFGAPDWAVTSLMFVILLGFPVSLILAWAFEFTPDGIKTQQAADASGQRSSGSKLNTLLFAGMALTIIFLVVDNYMLDDSPSAPAQAEQPENNASDDFEITATGNLEKSIAVLPFANQSNDPDQEYFADGLSEELLNRLARVQDLLVAGRTSSFYFKGRNESMREIGQQLGVAHILEGSVRKAGNEVRVSAQLIRADNGFQLWSATYDRKLEDIFMIQDEISEAVTTALSVTLSAGEFNRPGMTTNVQAYEAYLRADKSQNSDPARILQSISDLENAVAIDPTFGLAWSALYRTYEFSTISLPPAQSAEYVPLAAMALERTRQLIPASPDYLISSAMSQRRMGNFVEAEQLFQNSISQFGNSDAQANLNYGELLWAVGRVSDALPYLQRARRLDPKLVDIAARLASIMLALGQVEEGRAEIQRGLAINPENGFIRSITGMPAIIAGDYQKLFDGIGDQPAGSLEAAIKNALGKYLDGDQAGAIEDMRHYTDENVFSPATATVIGSIAAIFGGYDLALSILTGSAGGNINDMFGSFPIWQNWMSGMRQLDGFKDMAARSGLVDYWRTTGQWGDFCTPLAGNDDFECF